MKRKAFIHVVEIVIISLVVFAVVVQFSAIPKANNDWTTAKLFLKGNDLLFTLDKKGINWSDAGQVRTEFSKFIKPNIIYDLRIVDSSSVNRVVAYDIQNPVKVSIFKAENTTGFRPYEVVLRLGYLF